MEGLGCARPDAWKHRKCSYFRQKTIDFHIFIVDSLIFSAIISAEAENSAGSVGQQLRKAVPPRPAAGVSITMDPNKNPWVFY